MSIFKPDPAKMSIAWIGALPMRAHIHPAWVCGFDHAILKSMEAFCALIDIGIIASIIRTAII
jgi:hypothetical protein